MPETFSYAEWIAEQRRRFVRPAELLPQPWPNLRMKRGKDRLCNLPVYYDFNWCSIFGHDRKTFRNGRSLAGLVKQECPDDKYPGLLLTSRDDVDECPITTDTHFIVVVKIREYLQQSSADSATSYFARITKTQITGLSKLKEVVSTPEGLDIVLPLLSGEAIKDWAVGNSEALRQLAEITATSGFQELLGVLTVDDLTRILDWAVGPGNDGQAREIVSRLREESLPTLYTLTGIVRLRQALTLWETNRHNADEEFWQQWLGKSENTFVLSQLFSFPVVVLKGKAYVGGKGIENTGGNLVDFLMANDFTRNALLVEIKTPMTPLLGPLYRGDIHNVSSELSGAVQQSSNYRQQLIQNYHSLAASSSHGFHAFSPPSLVIAGCNEELDGPKKVKAFELYRNGLKDVQIITFDELFNKLTTLVDLLEGTVDAAAGHSSRSLTS